MSTRTVGIDIGGANLKYADGDGFALARSFAMWRHPDKLAETIAGDLLACGTIDSLAVTMTGELADCFADREVGVRHIVEHTVQASRQCGIGSVHFYGVDGQFHDASEACEKVDLLAAANWHALANFVGTSVAASALLIDIGSTTTDIVPIVDGAVATDARTDYDRMLQGSLVYVGCRRTPVCALTSTLEFRGHVTGVMNELFATIDDARLVLGTVAQQAKDTDTADSMPRTKEFAANRLARMIGLDRRSVSVQDSRELAQQVVQAASDQIRAGVQRMLQLAPRLETDPVYVVSGHGGDLLQLADNSFSLSLAEMLGDEMSRCAPALAVAQLLSCHAQHSSGS
ncbi:MAG: tetrahydromethanopterin-linked C1 transfer pathway [Pirellulaceae bacterium]|nr:tetrahydromethanopterin-linked C1 transfer pathway [Pirellulaceae bacterium]